MRIIATIWATSSRYPG